MCGIAGCFGYDDVEDILTKMNSAMAHRGPDGEGKTTYIKGDIKIGLAQRRLAIIDRAAGKQPMRSANDSN